MGEITAEHVLEQVRSAGGFLVLKGLTEEERAGWRHAVKIAYLRLHRVGREQLNISSGGDTLRIRLLQDAPQAADVEETAAPPAWSPPPPVLPRTAEFRGRRVPVPSKLTKPHPLVEQLVEASDLEGRMERRHRGYVASARSRPLQRMRRIWQALIVEAEFRGYRASLEHSRRDVWDTGRLVISIGPDDMPIVLSGGRKQPLELRLEIDGSRRRNQDTWTDAEHARLEGQLGALMTRIEEHAQEQVDRRAEELRQLLERRRRWEVARVAARRVFVEDYLRSTIAARVAVGREVRNFRAYGQAIERHAAKLSAEDRGPALEWVAWIRRYADEVDPVRAGAGIPVVPEPTDRDLRPYLERAGHSGWRP